MTRTEFLAHIGSALNHLYDPDFLRRSPLAALFGVDDRFDTPSSLQQILIGAIKTLEPDGGAPAGWRLRRFHDLLTYLHVQQLSQREVASLLGLSKRHIRRERRAALDPLASALWKEHGLELRLRESVDPVQASTDAPMSTGALREELAWLRDTPVDVPANFEDVLPAVLDLIRPLARDSDVTLVVSSQDELPPLAVHPVALRQVLLSALGSVIPHAPGSRITLSLTHGAECSEAHLRIDRRQPPPDPCSKRMASATDAARELADSVGCLLHSTFHNGGCEIRMSFPNLGATTVLVIDDNVDALRLMERFATGTRYTLSTTRFPETAVALALETRPRVIVLDVMMPGLDGFEMLGRLTQHPGIEKIPVVVCTVLDQEALALSLGASEFLKKPITRNGFLMAVDRQIRAQEPC